jgi:SAM-dependent methyltransferase
LPDREGSIDIGAGEGAFLAELRKFGFHSICGIEPSSAPIAAAAADIRPLIYQGIFEKGRFSPARFSLITCFQTIEHVPDPLALSREACRLLKPGGMFCLVGHNRRALSARVLGRKSPIFDLEHLQLFSHRSIRRLLTAAGFERIESRSLWNSYPLRYWLRLFPLPGKFKQKLTAALEASRWDRQRLALPAGNFVAIGFRPKSSARLRSSSIRTSPSAVSAS